MKLNDALGRERLRQIQTKAAAASIPNKPAPIHTVRGICHVPFGASIAICFGSAPIGGLTPSAAVEGARLETTLAIGSDGRTVAWGRIGSGADELATETVAGAGIC